MTSGERKEIRAEMDRAREDLKITLEREQRLRGHPKADLLFLLAWDMGHSGGLKEVAKFYRELAELLK